MKRISFSLLLVFVLIILDVNISMAYDPSKVKIFKVTNISNNAKLQLRAWPSPKSRVKVSLSANAKDLVETGKSRVIGKSHWVEVVWQKNQGWVNSHYLKKTGVLLHAQQNSRNNKPAKKMVIQNTSPDIPKVIGGDRYDHLHHAPVVEVKTAYAERNVGSDSKILHCSGSSPEPWNIKLNIANDSMQVNLSNNRMFTLPINYHAWASPSKVRMSLGGNKGRNIVDVNLEKTDACSNGLTNTNFPYRVNATINREFFSGCCQSVN